jgi:mRNA-degrading endonuclease RelE of RelBE toxin-antitoxin system
MSPRRRGAHGFLYRVEISAEAADIIRTLPPEGKRQIKQALVHLTEFPGAGKPLTEELAGLHSYRTPPSRSARGAPQDSV